ncbi:NAD(P)-dependent oxidoreductase, partial [Chloroflexota bacterium]
ITRDGIRQIWPPMFQVRGQTLGLVGFGRIGRLIVPKAKGFDMRVIAYDPFVPADVFSSLDVESVTMDRLLSESDYVSINASMTPGSEQMFGVQQFKQMKPTAYFINNARAQFVDEKALVEALSSDTIAGAGLDVVEGERALLDNPLLQLDNVVLTGHSAYYSEESSVMMRKRAYDMVGMVLKGGWPSMFINPEVKDKYQQRWGEVKSE